MRLNRNHHTDFYIKSENINYLHFKTRAIHDSQSEEAIGRMNRLEMSAAVKVAIDVYLVDFQMHGCEFYSIYVSQAHDGFRRAARHNDQAQTRSDWIL